MFSISKALIGTAAAGAMAVGAASPAVARDRDSGIDAGDVIAGALVIGGIAAVAAAASNRGDRYDRRNGNYRYDDDRSRGRNDRRGYNRGYQQDAVNQCIRAAESYAQRGRYTGRAQVTDIRDVDRERNGFEVKGRIAVQQQSRNYRRANWDEGRFKCEVRRGRVVDLDYSGIRGL